MAPIPHPWPAIVAKAWCDDKFKQELLTDPRKVLNEHGWQIDPDFDVQVKSGDARSGIHLSLPDPPDDVHVGTLEALKKAGGICAQKCFC